MGERMRRLNLASLAVLTCAAALLGACGGGDSGGAKTTAAPAKFDASKPVTITIWHPFTQREQKVFNGVIADFQKTHPAIKVKSVGGINDDKTVAAIRGGNPPDVAGSNVSDNIGAFCGSGGWVGPKGPVSPRQIGNP